MIACTLQTSSHPRLSHHTHTKATCWFIATWLHAQLPYLPTAETQQQSKPMAANHCQFITRCSMHSHAAQAGLAWYAHQLKYILHLLSWLTKTCQDKMLFSTENREGNNNNNNNNQSL
jgi:hypothetical protein